MTTTAIFQNDLELVGELHKNEFFVVCDAKILIENFFFVFSFAAADSKFLKTLLSFAVGGLLGDVFLHLLPEAWEYDMRDAKGKETLRKFFDFLLKISQISQKFQILFLF